MHVAVVEGCGMVNSNFLQLYVLNATHVNGA